jgi:pimeloyl-ACP methyl ester carboxylesterase
LRDIDFIDTGTGPILLFLPGSYSHFSAWKGIQKALKGSYRMISTSLPGYGGSKEIRGDAVQDMSLMSNFVADVISRVGEPVHLIGHSYGGLVSFAATLSGKASLLSLITFEGNPIFSRIEHGEFSWRASTLDMVQRFEAAYASGSPDAAGIIIDYWSKPETYSSMPQQFQDYCQSRVFTNILDWRSAAGFRPHFSEYAAINVPCTLVRGEFANQAIVDISDEISREIPDSSLHVVEGSNHFLISTHPEDCATIIDNHMTAYAACHNNGEKKI